jgi:hypothetical protein
MEAVVRGSTELGRRGLCDAPLIKEIFKTKR